MAEKSAGSGGKKGGGGGRLSFFNRGNKHSTSNHGKSKGSTPDTSSSPVRKVDTPPDTSPSDSGMGDLSGGTSRGISLSNSSPSLCESSKSQSSQLSDSTSSDVPYADDVSSIRESVKCVPNGKPLSMPQPIPLQPLHFPPMSESQSSTEESVPLAHTRQSPGTQSLASTTSVATVVAADISAHSEYHEDRGKQTLGMILHQIEEKAERLLQVEDFTTHETLPDLQFLAHQSRYTSDINIKKRLVSRMVERGLLDIFFRVYRSVQTVEYWKKLPVEPILDSNEDITSEESVSKEDLHAGQTNGIDDLARERRDSTTSHGSEMNLHNGDGIRPERDKWPTATEALKNLRAAITCVWNASEKSPTLCEECIKRGGVRLLFSALVEPKLGPNEVKDHHKMYIVKGYLGILNNIIRFHNEARDIFREAGAVKILQQYMKSSLLVVKTKSMMLMSYVISESENDIINSSDRNISFLVKMLQSTIESENHYSKKYGYWAVEVAAAVNRLASCESNKDRLARKALPSYMRLLQGGCAEEQIVATQGIWSLAFSEAARQLLSQDMACMEVLSTLGATSPRDEIRKAASGAMWVLQGKANTPRLSHRQAVHEGSQVMISYQWATRPVVLHIRDRLRSAGYRVWVDIDIPASSGGDCDGIDSILRAIDRAAVVLLCTTQKYKDSPSSRTEAEYAYRQRKELIPVRLQPKYHPEGWLARVVGNRMYFDFSKEGNLDLLLPNLVRDLAGRGRVKTPEPSIGSGSSSDIQGVEGLPSLDPLTRVATWTEQDVYRWLRDSDLSHVSDRFRQMDGELLLELHKMQHNAPEAFYAVLRTELSFNLISILRFTKALDMLGQM